MATPPTGTPSATQKSLEAAYKVKCEILGGGKNELSEIRVLNRVIRRDGQGLTLEADPRHAEIVVRDLCLENAKPSKLPGSKEEHKRSGGGPSGAGVYPINAIDVEPQGAVDAEVDMHEYIDKYTSKGKGRGSVRESAGLGKNADGARLAPVHCGDGAASELVASRGVTSVFAPPAEVVLI